MDPEVQATVKSPEELDQEMFSASTAGLTILQLRKRITLAQELVGKLKVAQEAGKTLSFVLSKVSLTNEALHIETTVWTPITETIRFLNTLLLQDKRNLRKEEAGGLIRENTMAAAKLRQIEYEEKQRLARAAVATKKALDYVGRSTTDFLNKEGGDK